MYLSLGYLVYGKVDVAVQFLLRVNGLRSVVLITLQEKVFERGSVLLFERHHHLVAQSEQHQLRGRVGDKTISFNSADNRIILL